LATGLMDDRFDDDGWNAQDEDTVRSSTRQARYTLPRQMPTPPRLGYQPTLIDTWRQLPRSTKFYFSLIAGLVFLFLMLLTIRSASLPLSLSFLRSLRGEQVTPQATTSAFLSGISIAADAPVVTAQVNAELRGGPSDSYPSVGLLEAGQQAQVVGISEDGFWWAIRVLYLENGQAWVLASQVLARNTDAVEILSPPAGLAPAIPATPVPAIVTALLNVNVRSGPGMEYPRIGLLQEGQDAEAVGVDAEGLWYAIKVPGEENSQGWVSKDYIKIKNADSLPVAGPEAGKPILIALTIVNIRAGPGQEYEIIGSLENGLGAEVVGVSQDGEWWAIAFANGPNGYGWVSAKFVKVQNVQDVPVIK
jgi:uncharacterized protein YraI